MLSCSHSLGKRRSEAGRRSFRRVCSGPPVFGNMRSLVFLSPANTAAQISTSHPGGCTQPPSVPEAAGPQPRCRISTGTQTIPLQMGGCSRLSPPCFPVFAPEPRWCFTLYLPRHRKDGLSLGHRFFNPETESPLICRNLSGAPNTSARTSASSSK